MNAVMIYYLYANAPAGLGFDKADAAQLISLYATVVGMTTIIGSYVCDRILGCRRSLLVARVTGFIGYTLLAFPLGVVGYAAAMGCMVFGSLFAGRCIETLIGKFYDENDGRRDSAFTISYVISNIGAAAPALAGVIAAKCGYHAAFALSAVLSFLGTVAYIATYKKFFGNIGLEPDDPLPADKKRSFVVNAYCCCYRRNSFSSFICNRKAENIFLCKRSKYYFHLYPACLSCLHLLKQEDRKAREKESTLSASTIYL